MHSHKPIEEDKFSFIKRGIVLYKRIVYVFRHSSVNNCNTSHGMSRNRVPKESKESITHVVSKYITSSIETYPKPPIKYYITTKYV